MNSKITASFVAAAASVFFAGCDTVPTYPVSYQIPIGYTQVATPYGTQSINVSATHDSNVEPGVPMFYQVSSPVPLTLYVFDKTGPGPGGVLLNQTQGTNITASATATSNVLEFVFSTAQAYTNGTVQLTVSDRPLPATATPLGPLPVTQSTTTTTTTGAPVPQTSSTSTTTTTVAPAPTPVMDQTHGP